MVKDVWKLNDKHGLRSGPNSANEAKTRGRQNTRQKTKTENRNRQRQEICWKVAEIPLPER